jgi:hypothetical protein
LNLHAFRLHLLLLLLLLHVCLMLLLLLLLLCVLCVTVAELLHYACSSRRRQRPLGLCAQACLRLAHHLCWDAAVGQGLLELVYHDALPRRHTPVGALQLVCI